MKKKKEATKVKQKAKRLVVKTKKKVTRSKAVKSGRRHAGVIWGELKQIERELVGLFGRTVKYQKRKAQLKRELAILVRKI